MTDIQIDAGTLTASVDERTVTGLLVPYGEEARSNLGKFTVDTGAFSIPDDFSVVGFNLEHAREDVLGRATELHETPEGIVATFSVAKTPEGDAALADIAAGERKHLSAEVAHVVIKAGKAVSGRLFGGALVKSPAFPSATLLAAAADTQPATGSTDSTAAPVVTVDAEGTAEIVTDTLPDRVSVTTPDSTEAMPFVPETSTAKEPGVATATAPSTLNASAPEQPNASNVFDAIRAAGNGDDTLLGALSDIKTSGTSQLGTNAIQPAWLGEVWAEKAYQRKYWGLVKNGTVTAMDEKGFILDQAAPLVAPYAGNKAAVPTGNGTASVVSSVFQRWAVAVDIAREFFDIPGNTAVIEAFVRRFFNDYAKVTDQWALQQMYTAGGTAVDAETYPTQYNPSIGKLIQAVDALDDTDVEPSFIIASPDVYKELRYTPKDLVPEYVTFTANRQDGTADGVQVLRDKFGVLAAGEVLVGGHDAAHLNELGGGSPLTVDAIDIANGGIDKAVHGYTQYMTEYADGFIIVGNAGA